MARKPPLAAQLQCCNSKTELINKTSHDSWMLDIAGMPTVAQGSRAAQCCPWRFSKELQAETTNDQGCFYMFLPFSTTCLQVSWCQSRKSRQKLWNHVSQSFSWPSVVPCSSQHPLLVRVKTWHHTTHQHTFSGNSVWLDQYLGHTNLLVVAGDSNPPDAGSY